MDSESLNHPRFEVPRISWGYSICGPESPSVYCRSALLPLLQRTLMRESRCFIWSLSPLQKIFRFGRHRFSRPFHLH